MENVNILSLYRSRFRSSMKVTVISFNIFDGETVSTEERLTPKRCSRKHHAYSAYGVFVFRNHGV